MKTLLLWLILSLEISLFFVVLDIAKEMGIDIKLSTYAIVYTTWVIGILAIIINFVQMRRTQ